MVFADHSAVFKIFHLGDLFAWKIRNSPGEVSKVNSNNALFTIFHGKEVQRIATVAAIKPLVGLDREVRNRYISNTWKTNLPHSDPPRWNQNIVCRLCLFILLTVEGTVSQNVFNRQFLFVAKHVAFVRTVFASTSIIVFVIFIIFGIFFTIVLFFAAVLVVAVVFLAVFLIVFRFSVLLSFLLSF